MKCEEKECERESKFTINGRSYCSAFCVHVDLPTASESTKSKRMAAYSTTVALGQSQVSRNAGLRIKKEIVETVKSDKLEQEKDTMKILTITDSLHAKKQIADENETAIESEKKSGSQELSVTPQPGLENSLQVYAEVTPHHSNLLDSSITQLHELMNVVASNVKDKTTVDAGLVNSACNCAKQMATLLKLKVDFVKMNNRNQTSVARK